LAAERGRSGVGDGADGSAATGAGGGRVSALAAKIDGIDLEDGRLNRRARRLLEQLGDQPMLRGCMGTSH